MRISTIALVALVLAGCQAMPYTKGNDVASSMSTATDRIESLKQSAAATKSSFDAVLAPDADLVSTYRGFVSSVDRFERALAAMTQGIDGVGLTTNEYLDGYSARREEVKNIDLRAAMLMRREEIERQMTDMRVELSNLIASSDVLLRDLKDLRIFLEASLNPRAVAPASPVGEKLASSIENIALSADRVSLELKDLSASLVTETPPALAIGGAE